MGDGRSKDVSCLALTFFYDYLQSRGVPRNVLQEGLPYTPEYLDQRINWIDWETFLEIEHRVDSLFDDPELFFRIGRTFGATRGFGFLRVLFRAVLTPYQVYAQLQRLVGRFLFPFVTIRIERKAPKKLQATYSFEPPFEPTDAFLETIRGVLSAAPMSLGLPAAEVRGERLSPLEARFDISLARRASFLRAVRGAPKRWLMATRMRLTNLRESVKELEETNQLLGEQVEALTTAKGELNLRVRDLSVLHTVLHVAAQEKELPALLSELTRQLSEALDGVPLAVLLREGEPPGWVVAASRGLSLAEQESLLRLHERPEKATGPWGLTLKGRRFLVAPMFFRDERMGTLVLGEIEPRGDMGLAAALANELAIVVDSALAFRTIADLRDNLEVRVQERTSELEEAHLQLEETVEQLRRSDRSRNEFFMNVSHELRTPLTLILAPLDNLETQLGPDEHAARAELRLIRQNANVLLRQINEILDFARLDADAMPLDPRWVDLGDLLTGLGEELAPLAEKKRVRLRVSVPEGGLPAWLDPVLGRRMFFNLVLNAVKYVRRGDVVEVSADTEGDELRVRVSDSGPGIAPEHREQVFERFQRIEARDGRPVEGSGIGLAMVREIARHHDGRVTLTDSPLGGAEFTLWMPRAEGAAPELSGLPSASTELDAALIEEGARWDDEVAFPGAVEAADADDVPSSRGIGEGTRWSPPGAPGSEAPEGHVLVIEDNPQMRAFLERLLGRRYHVSWARDGQEGLQRARDELPDVIVSDVMMPRMDGYALCRELKAGRLTRSIPVLLVSARHGTEAALDGFRAGADDFVVKPFSAPELLARIHAQLRIRTMARALMRTEKQMTLGLVSAGIAHEVLNPTNAVINAIPPVRRLVQRNLQEDTPGSERADLDALLETVERAGQRVRQIVQALLSLGRESEGRLPLQEVRLRDVIEPVLTLLTHRLDGSIRLHRDYAWEGIVECAPELLGQVVMNLLVNAFDALGPDGGNVWLRTERWGDELRIRVRDDGPGVRVDRREKVFEAFFTTKAPGQGTGLGLPLSRELVAMHGGELELLNEPGKGAEFIIRLPMAPAEGASRGPAELHA